MLWIRARRSAAIRSSGGSTSDREPPGVMPSDGVQSISVMDAFVPTDSVGVNSPTNLAGGTGTVVSPSAASSDPAWGILLGLLLVGTGLLSIAYRRRAT